VSGMSIKGQDFHVNQTQWLLFLREVQQDFYRQQLKEVKAESNPGMEFPDPAIQVRIPAWDTIVAGVSRAGQGERAGRVTVQVVISPGN